MKGNRRIKQTFVVVTLLYSMSVIIIIYSMFAIPRTFSNFQNTYYQRMKNEIETILENSYQDKEQQLADLANNEAIEFFIMNKSEDRVLYSTLPIANIDDFYGALNQNAITVEESFELITQNNQYHIWLAVYTVSPQETLNFGLIILLVVVGIFMILLLTILLLIFYRSIRPLQRLRDNIWKISSYQLTNLRKHQAITEQDALSYELVSFADDLQAKMQSVDVKYTSLERELQSQKEMMEYRAELLGSLTHDLKRPIHILLLKIEETMRLEMTKQQATVMEDGYHKLENLTKDINDIVRIAHMNDLNVLLEKTYFNITEVLTDEYYHCMPLFKSKFFQTELFVDLDIMIYANVLQFKQLIHNALVNIYHYAPEHANVTISCYQEEDQLHLVFYNDAKQMTEEQLENIFHLFYRISDESEGSGTGLHTMKVIAEENAGNVTMENQDKGVALTFVFPKTIFNTVENKWN